MELVILIGRPGSGKTTYYNKYFQNSHYLICQDLQGKQYKQLFEKAISEQKDIVVDRQNHIKEQRDYFTELARQNNYTITIIEFKIPKNLAEQRILNRNDHPTIDNTSDVRSILNLYDKKYQSVEPSERDSYLLIEEKYYAPILDLTNLKGKILVLSDLHGCFDEFLAAYNKFKPDYVILGGDLSDRGPKSRELFEFVLNNDNVYSVIGNHDDKLKRYLLGNKIKIGNGLQETIDQISDWDQEKKQKLYRWLQSLPSIIKLPKDYVVVHGGFNPNYPLNKQMYETCLYIRTFGGAGWDDNDYPNWYQCDLDSDLKQYKILFGHITHPIANVKENIIALDMGAAFGKGLRCILIDTNGEDQMEEFETPTYYQPSKEGLFEKHEQYVKEGWLTKSVFEDLVLYNYSDATTFSKKWDQITLNARGTIYNKDTGEIVGLAMSKFFNVNESPDTHVDQLPWDKPFQAFEKCDGSMGVLYRHNNQFKISTRGSFYSNQAKKATKMLEKYNTSSIPDDATLIFEIIYPENKIVVDYKDKEELVLLAAYNFKTGVELVWDQVVSLATTCGFSLPKVYNYTLDDLLEQKELIKWNENEGWVIRFSNGMRVKLKGTKYLEMAKILSRMSPLAVWETILEGRLNEYLLQVPEEIRDQAEVISDKLTDQLAVLKDKCIKVSNKLKLEQLDLNDKQQAKQLVSEIIKYCGWMKGYLFSVMRKTPDDKILLKLLRPTNNEYVNLVEFKGEDDEY